MERKASIPDAIAWLEQEAAALRRAPALNGCPMQPQWEEPLSVYLTALDALNAAKAVSGGSKAETITVFCLNCNERYRMAKKNFHGACFWCGNERIEVFK